MTTHAGGSASSVDPWAPFSVDVLDGLVAAAAASGVPLDRDTVSAQLTLSPGPEGDFALPVHRFAAAARRPPNEVAGALAAHFTRAPGLSEVKATGAYVNVRVDGPALVRSTLETVVRLGGSYGHHPAGGPPACVEHTSANPTGPFHIGRVRNAIIGDTFARALRASGVPVTTQYYVDDMGRQAAMISWIWSRPPSEWPTEIQEAVAGKEVPGEKPDAHRGRPYPAVSAYLKEHPDAQAAVAQLVAEIEAGRPPANHHALAQAILDGMLASLARLGIGFDEFVWESSFVSDGSVDRVLERLRTAAKAVREPNGAVAIDTSGHGLPKESTRVVVQRGNGTSLYVTRDIAYHLAKFARFSRVIDVLGQDHQLHARTLDALLAEIGEPRRPEFVIYQDITVPEGGRMSTRGGSAVWLDGLLDEALERARREVAARRDDLSADEMERIAEAVATGAIRYHIVRVAPEKPVVFRWEDALSFEGRSGPFVQYAYARAASLLRKAEDAAPPYPFDPARLGHPDEHALVRVVATLPRAVEYAARSTHVQGLASYAHDLADQFNRFYHAVPVLKSGEERVSRLALVAAVRQTLGNALDLLGVARLETM